jgi:excisionase family DNA binding protein
MNQPALPLPQPKDWMTRRAAAEYLGCSVRTVERYARDGVLTEYHPVMGKIETNGMWLLLWRAEVETLKQARNRIKVKNATNV